LRWMRWLGRRIQGCRDTGSKFRGAVRRHGTRGFDRPRPAQMAVGPGGVRVRPGAGWIVAAGRLFAGSSLPSDRTMERNRELPLVFRNGFKQTEDFER